MGMQMYIGSGGDTIQNSTGSPQGCVHARVRVHVRASLCVHARARASVRAHACACPCACTFARAHARMHVRTCAYACVCSRPCVCAAGFHRKLTRIQKLLVINTQKLRIHCILAVLHEMPAAKREPQMLYGSGCKTISSRTIKSSHHRKRHARAPRMVHQTINEVQRGYNETRSTIGFGAINHDQLVPAALPKRRQIQTCIRNCLMYTRKLEKNSTLVKI
jgi:hypothetical protein